ncbi:hypothetical protein KCP75_22410 [Salmonella enterica subsp. enterica]|nr:hypothetical protein KCP75_22410 [Salmonella enterica subsp. enterica]
MAAGALFGLQAPDLMFPEGACAPRYVIHYRQYCRRFSISRAPKIPLIAIATAVEVEMPELVAAA